MTWHEEIDHAYQQVGKALTWEKCITCGYHVYDHCFQFETHWERMQENEMDVLTFILHVYFYHVNRALDIPTKLKRWAIDIAHPYLLNNLSSALTPEISDPRNAWMDYEEPEFMYFDAEMESKIPANDWKMVGRNCDHTKRQHKHLFLHLWNSRTKLQGHQSQHTQQWQQQKKD